MSEQDNERKGSISRRALMKVAGAALVGGYLAPKQLRAEVIGAQDPYSFHKGEPEPLPEYVGTPGKTTKSKKYQHLLTPIKIGNHVLKNRMIGTPSSPHFLVGPESCPNDAIIYYYGNKARAGASLVVLSQPIGVRPENDEDVLEIRAKAPNMINPDHGTDVGHFPWWDLANAGAQNKLSQLTEAVHFYDSLCLWKPKIDAPAGYDVSPGNPTEVFFGTDNLGDFGFIIQGPPPAHPKKEITEEMLQKIIEDVSLECALSKECGFDGIFLHSAYRAPLPARMLSPLTNRRKDKYGGSLENRARFAIEIADAVKKRCGEDFFIMTSMSGHEPEGGYTVDDGAEFAKLFTGHMDLLNIKGDPGERDSAPTGFMLERTPFIDITEAYKKKGVTITLSCDGGFTDLDLAEEALASGKTDTCGMSRAFITTPELGRLAFEGRDDDVVPCLRCNACHGNGFLDTAWNSTCKVNPIYGLDHKIDKMISPPLDKKKVAVIGGGPAGMEAAMTAAKRGHTVTLYEKTGSLGGIFKKVENVTFKWPHRDFKNYLVHQIGKSNVTVRLNTNATPAMIKKEGYDAVIVAIGGQPVVPDLPGIDGKNVMFAPDVYGKEDTLAKDVVIIGGGTVGTETGVHLAEQGHRVTVLEPSDIIARDNARVHYYSAFEHYWEQLPNFHPIVKARCNGITKSGVTYIDADGKQQSVKAGSVVVAVGMTHQADLALTFEETGDEFYMIGDCEVAEDVRRAIRSAFATASRI